MNITVEQGSEYNPGWVVYEQVAEHHFQARATFDEKAHAEEFAANLREGAEHAAHDEL